jgi:hypothetical protein
MLEIRENPRKSASSVVIRVLKTASRSEDTSISGRSCDLVRFIRGLSLIFTKSYLSVKYDPKNC